jgi:hypothetical protein
MIAIIGGVIGRPLRYQEIPAEAAKQGRSSMVSPSRSSRP